MYAVSTGTAGGHTSVGTMPYRYRRPGPARPADRQTATLRVLLVEDDLDDVRLLRASIASDDVDPQVDLTHAGSLADARRHLTRGDFDVALLDLGLPDGRGLETYRYLDQITDGLPIVVLSGDTDHDLAVAAVREGAQDYLIKGRVSGDAMMRVLRYAVERGRVLARERAALRQEREAVERLRHLDEMKDAFLQAVSHELRTPLASVYGYALTLRDNGARLSEEQRDHVIERLAFNADRLRRLLDDLLDVNRLSAGAVRIDTRPEDLAVLVRGVLDKVEMPHHQVETDLRSVPVVVEPCKVERIVENLLKNAAKHTPAGTTVWVRTRAVEGGALLTVADDGPGIADALKQEVFAAFRQGPDSRRAANPGTGIGLNLVAKFAELHGGRAWVEDRPGGGASFNVLLPHDVHGDRSVR